MDNYEKVLGERLIPTYEELKSGLLRLIDEGKISREDAARVLPELRESEDERIRKWLVDYFSSIKDTVWIHRNTITCEQILAWLEKQKENPKNADSIPEDCVSLAKCEDRDSKYGVFPEDVIVVARACEKLEAHGYSELAHALKNVNLYTKPIDYDHEMWKNCEANFEGGKKEVIDHPEKYGLQKEQKHPNGCFTCDEYKKGYEAGRLNGFTAGYNKAMKEMEQKDQKPVDDSDFKTALAEYMTKNCTGHSFNISSESILQMAKEELIKRGELKEQKPNYCHYGGDPSVERCKYCSAACGARLTEEQNPVVTHGETYHVDTLGTQQVIAGKMPQKPAWSEEDEKDMAHIIRILDDCYAYGKHDLSKTDHENLVNKLKSLRPQPKQEWSEEDERILKGIIGKIDHDQSYGVSKAEMLEYLNGLQKKSKLIPGFYFVDPHGKRYFSRQFRCGDLVLKVKSE